MALDTTGLVTDLQDLLRNLRASGSLKQDEIEDSLKWGAGFASAVESGEKVKAANYQTALEGLMGAVIFREAEVGRKALLKGLSIGLDWVLKIAVAAIL